MEDKVVERETQHCEVSGHVSCHIFSTLCDSASLLSEKHVPAQVSPVTEEETTTLTLSSGEDAAKTSTVVSSGEAESIDASALCLIDEGDVFHYTIFRALANGFRWWRSHTMDMKQFRFNAVTWKDFLNCWCRKDKEEAIANQMLAASFWEFHVLLRLIHRWRRRRSELFQCASQFWIVNQTLTFFELWRLYTAKSRMLKEISLQFFNDLYLRKSLQAWVVEVRHMHEMHTTSQEQYAFNTK